MPDEPLPHFGQRKPPLGKARFRFEDLSDDNRAILRALVLALKGQGYGYRRIREMTGLSMEVILRITRAARESGDLKDVLLDMDHDLVPLAVDTYRRALVNGDVDVAGDVLKGRGILVNHQKTAATSINAHVLEVRWKNAPTGGAPIDTSTLPGQIAASPRKD